MIYNKYQIDYKTAIQQLTQSKQKGNLAVFMGSGVSSFVSF